MFSFDIPTPTPPPVSTEVLSPQQLEQITHAFTVALDKSSEYVQANGWTGVVFAAIIAGCIFGVIYVWTTRNRNKARDTGFQMLAENYNSLITEFKSEAKDAKQEVIEISKQYADDLKSERDRNTENSRNLADAINRIADISDATKGLLQMLHESTEAQAIKLEKIDNGIEPIQKMAESVETILKQVHQIVELSKDIRSDQTNQNTRIAELEQMSRDFKLAVSALNGADEVIQKKKTDTHPIPVITPDSQHSTS